jgi:hypothetical protein
MALREAATALMVVVPFALGLSAGATVDDPAVVFRFQDRAIVESSGLTVLPDGRFVTVNDSGDEARVFTVDPATGRTVGVTRWDGEADDVEALAPAGPGAVWVGDIGDNTEERTGVQVVRVPVGEGDRSVAGERVTLAYPTGPANAEALLAHPGDGRLVVATKDVFGGTLYASPSGVRPGDTVTLQELGGVIPVVTDGAFFPDGRHLVLRNYAIATVYSWPDLEQVGRVDIPPQQQGEGIAVDADNRVYVSSEGIRSPVLEVELPPRLADAVSGVEPEEPEQSSTPEPSDEPTPTGKEAPEDDDGWPADAFPWLIGSGLLVVAVVVLVRSLRRR